MDTRARHHGAKPEFRGATFFGRLERVLALEVQASRRLSTTVPETVIFAVVKECKITEVHRQGLDIHYADGDGSNAREQVIDLACVQCIVARVYLGGRWAFVDRSGAMARALFLEEQPRGFANSSGEEDNDADSNEEDG